MGSNESIMDSNDFLMLHFYPASVPRASIRYYFVGTIKGMIREWSLIWLVGCFFGYYFL